MVNFTFLPFYSCVNLQVVRGAQFMQLNQLVKGRPGDAQQPGGLGLIPAGLHQGL